MQIINRPFLQSKQWAYTRSKLNRPTLQIMQWAYTWLSRLTLVPDHEVGYVKLSMNCSNEHDIASYSLSWHHIENRWYYMFLCVVSSIVLIHILSSYCELLLRRFFILHCNQLLFAIQLWTNHDVPPCYIQFVNFHSFLHPPPLPSSAHPPSSLIHSVCFFCGIGLVTSRHGMLHYIRYQNGTTECNCVYKPGSVFGAFVNIQTKHWIVCTIASHTRLVLQVDLVHGHE